MEVLDSVANTEKEMSLAALTEVTLFPTYLLFKKINVFLFLFLLPSIIDFPGPRSV